MKSGLLILLFAHCFVLLPAAEPPREPILRIESGMHSSGVERIGTDAEGRWLASSSDDRTVRVWDARTGELHRVLRPPIGLDADMGRVLAVAMAPSGDIVACGVHGNYGGAFLTVTQVIEGSPASRAGMKIGDRIQSIDGAKVSKVSQFIDLVQSKRDLVCEVLVERGGRSLNLLVTPRYDPNAKTTRIGAGLELGGTEISLYLFERSTGSLWRRIHPVNGEATRLAFSADGRFLASVSTYGALEVWRTGDGLQLAKHSYPNASYGVSFSIDGRLATTCDDGLLRVYDQNFRKIAEERSPDGNEPFSIAWSPDGSRLVVGYADSCKVSVLSSRDLSPLLAPDIGGIQNRRPFNLSCVQFSSDGRTLYAGGSWHNNFAHPIRFWAEGGRGGYRDVVATDNTLRDFAPRPDGGVFFAGGSEAFGFVDSRGVVHKLGRRTMAEFRSKDDIPRLLASQDGTRVGFKYDHNGLVTSVFSLLSQSLSEISSRQGLRPPILSTPNIVITGDGSSKVFKVNGVSVPLYGDDSARCHAFAKDEQRIALGTRWYVRLLDKKGSGQWQTPVSGDVWELNITENGQLVVAACGDGTIRWFRMKDGRELLALFPHADRKRWVVWTPEGYYDCSIGGEELIGWHVNNGLEAADFFPAARFRATKYRPDVIAKVLDTLDTQEALRLANVQSGRRHEETEVKLRLPPVVAILAPRDGSQFTTTETTIRYLLRTPSGEPVTSIRALVDGRTVDTVRGQQAVGLKADGSERELRLTLPERDCEVAIIAENRYAASEPAKVRLKWAGRPAAPLTDALKPKLYVLAVGVSEYARESLRLKFAAKDARDFTAAFQAQQGGLYRAVETRVLTDQEASKDAVLDGLEWLRNQVTARDVGMLFLAGHGLTDTDGTFFYLPHGADPEKLLRTGVSQSDLQLTLRNLAGKALFFVDACHSGRIMSQPTVATRRSGAPVDVTLLVNELTSAENGVVVFCSSSGRQSSMEKDTWSNGAFTKALVEGIGGKADVLKLKKITVAALELYISERVKELTDGLQTPVVRKPDGVPDLPIAVVK